MLLFISQLFWIDDKYSTMRIHEIINEDMSLPEKNDQSLNEMNERIHQLLRQATADAANHTGVDIHNPQIERFAELIVRECVALLGDIDMTDQERYDAVEKINSAFSK